MILRQQLQHLLQIQIQYNTNCSTSYKYFRTRSWSSAVLTYLAKVVQTQQTCHT